MSVEVLSHTESGVKLKFGVSDSGIGIAPDKVEAIFSDFEQGDSSTSRKFGGTGLGLAISKRLVELLGGKIWVESRVDVGSVFFFTLDSEVVSGFTVSHNPENFAGNTRVVDKALCILLAEDNPVNQKLAKRVLENRGHQVFVVSDGYEALTAVKEHSDNLSLVLMDCQMPTMNGFDATKEIRAMLADSERRLPIIAMTANAMAGDRERCLEVGMDDYISKPFITRELIELVERWGFRSTREEE
jgi:CheY-like chemotaxis protein